MTSDGLSPILCAGLEKM